MQIVVMSLKHTNKLWSITDLVKMIGQYKHEFENISDIEKLNATRLFQHIIAIIFNCNSDNGVIKYDNRTGERLSIRVCKCDHNMIIVQAELFHKYKRISYYMDTMFLDKNACPINNQRLLANWILNNQMLLHFVTCDGDIV